ncbi:MAG: hypothetical protein ACLP8X_34300 [Streptosporangiaceae bacterium]
MSSSRPPTLLEYLIEHDFVPAAEGTWFDHDTGDGTSESSTSPARKPS